MEPHNHSHEIIVPEDISQSFYMGIFVNLVFASIEIGYGYIRDSTAVMSDGVHNIGDVSGLVLALVGYKLQKIKSGKIFTYGFRKASILASFFNSVLLAFAIGAISWEGIQRMIDPKPIDGLGMIVIASIGIGINFGSALLFRKPKEDDLNTKAAYWHLMADALVSLGVVLGGILIYFTGWNFLDGLITILISAVILLSTWGLFKDSVIALLDGIPSKINLDEIRDHLLAIKGVLEIHHLHIWNISTSQVALTCHIKINDLRIQRELKFQIKEELKEHGIDHATVEFEESEENCNDK